MNLSQIRHALAEARVQPIKTLGQNFLHDQNLARWIVEQAEIESDDFVVEIGPGLGALTEEILSRGARLLALEKDARLVAYLHAKFPHQNFEVQHCDALKFDTRSLFAEWTVKILGNLPYYVASQLLLRFVEHPSSNVLALFMLQDEMARRIAAGAGSDDYGALTLRMQLHHRIEYLRKVSPTVFFPRPDVSSAIVRIVPRAEIQTDVFDAALFREIVRLGFSQRRKQLRKLLATRVINWEVAAKQIGFSVAARGEELSRGQWIALANFIAPQVEPDTGKSTEEYFPVVDAKDRQIRTACRAEVHANNLRHRAVHILIFSSRGDVLLQKRSPWKDRHPLLWDSSAAGHVEADEMYDQAAIRELEEELGIRAKIERIDKLSASERTGQEFIWVYRGEHNGPFQFSREEMTAVQFFPSAIIDKWVAKKPEDFAPGFLESWKLWRTRHPSVGRQASAAAGSTVAISPNTRRREAERNKGVSARAAK